MTTPVPPGTAPAVEDRPQFFTDDAHDHDLVETGT
jgi:hypothetical protein